MGKRTPLYETHVSAGAKMVDFGGWDMPLHYGSQIVVHHLVRCDAGMFVVLFLSFVDLRGERVQDFLRYLVANNIDKLNFFGGALYTCMLNERGGVIDDLIVYFVEPRWYRLVVNAATRDKDLAWITQQAQSFGVEVRERAELAMIAIQGPQARDKTQRALGDIVRAATALQKPFTFVVVGDLFIARTGYTGEDGYEIILPAAQAAAVWQKLQAAGVKPAGLGARDTLRLEAGMNLYGSDMDEMTSPLESGLAWTGAFEPASRAVVGRAALEAAREKGVIAQFVGLVLQDKGVLRNHQQVLVDGEPLGEITSGGFSPTLGKAIALARLCKEAIGRPCKVDLRSKRIDVKVVKPPFVRNGKACIDLNA